MEHRFLTVLLFMFIAGHTFSQQSIDWKTDYEKSNYLKTPRYAETIEYCKRLAAASPWVHYQSFGKSPQGRDLPLVILSKEKAFTPEAAARTKKSIVLIQSSIHAGECDGKDASLMLMREIAITKSKAHLLDHAVILFVPIFNVDGHERFGKYNRINQEGPEEMGWRVTANNLNLNRDYMKADSPEMRGMLTVFSHWLPDFYIDCHVTDGMDFQYSVTFGLEVFQNADPSLAAWLKSKYVPEMTAQVERSGNLMAPYMGEREENDLSKGFVFGPATPRFSTGYGAIQNRPALLIETHVYKPYRTRVTATYEVLDATLDFVNKHTETLRSLNRHADEVTAKAGVHGESIPIRYQTIETSVPIVFRGWKTTRRVSPVTGQLMTYYSRDTMNVVVPYFDQVAVTDSVFLPNYYLIPQEWSSVIDVLKVHGISMTRLKTPTTLDVDSYRFSDPHWMEKPYEGRHPVATHALPIRETVVYPAGTYVVSTAQRTAKVIANLLEPAGPDSFVSWGFFDSVFEQKEYFEEAVMEKIAAEMMANDPSLQREFTAKVGADTSFAKSARERLNYFYQRSPYIDKTYRVYPIAKYNGKL